MTHDPRGRARRWTAAAVLAIGGASLVAAAPAAAAASRAHYSIGFHGVRGVHLGESVHELKRHGYHGQKLTSGCTQYTKGSTGLYVLASQTSHRVLAVDPVGDPRYRTPAGIHIGSSLHAVEHAYRHHKIVKRLNSGFGQGASGLLVKGPARSWLGFAIGNSKKVFDIKLGRRHYADAEEAPC